MNHTQMADQFWRDGYLWLKGFFDAPLMDRYQHLITDYFGQNPHFIHNKEFLSKSATEVVPWFPQREGVADFDIVDQHPTLNALTTAILGDSWARHYAMVMFSKPGSSGQAWHQDCPPDNPDLFNVNRLIYTEDIQQQFGGLVIVVPGTHRQGMLPTGDPHEDLPEQLAISPRKGDLLLLHGHTWHRVLPVKAKARYSTNFRCGPHGAPEDITDVCVYRNMRYRFSTNQVVEARQ